MRCWCSTLKLIFRCRNQMMGDRPKHELEHAFSNKALRHKNDQMNLKLIMNPKHLWIYNRRCDLWRHSKTITQFARIPPGKTFVFWQPARKCLQSYHDYAYFCPAKHEVYIVVNRGRFECKHRSHCLHFFGGFTLTLMCVSTVYPLFPQVLWKQLQAYYMGGIRTLYNSRAVSTN